MKNLFIYLTAIILTFAFTANINAEISAKKTVKFKCDEMTCTGCKTKITESVKSLQGIKKIKIDLDTKIVTVIYDDTKTNPEAIKSAIAEAGYESVMLD